MKKIIIVLSVAVPLLSHAQGMIYVNNLGDAPGGSTAIGNNSWIAQEFTWEGTIVNGTETTPNLTLNSVQLLMDSASGNPSGFTVSIYSSHDNLLLGDSLGTLSGSANPSSSGIYTYTTPGITLSPATSYFVVVTTATPTSQGAYNWSFVAAPGDEIANSNLVINDIYYGSSDGSSWTEHLRQEVFQMAIYATPIPEPQISALFGLGLFCLGLSWRQRK